MQRSCGVMVSTLDFESKDPSSSLGRTSLFFFLFFFFSLPFFSPSFRSPLFFLFFFFFPPFTHFPLSPFSPFFFLFSLLLNSFHFNFFASPFPLILFCSTLLLFPLPSFQFSYLYFHLISVLFFAASISFPPCISCSFSFTHSFIHAFIYSNWYRCRERDFLKKIHESMEREGKVFCPYSLFLSTNFEEFFFPLQVLIPVFALGRAQELCILLETFWYVSRVAELQD